MKLRNIFLAGLAVCTMASCSNDEEINQGPQQQVDAMVSFGITTDVITRADKDEEKDKILASNEEFIKELTALIFDADGKLVGRKDTVQPDSKKDQSINKIEHVTIKVTPSNGSDGKSNETFQAVLIANASQTVANVTRLSDLEDGTAALELKNYSKGMIDGSVRLPMASKTLEFTGIKPLGDKHTENWIYQEGGDKIGIVESLGDPVKAKSFVIPLYRLVARIDLQKVTIGDEVDLDFILTRVFLANVASKSPVKYLTEEKNMLVETGTNFAGNLWKGFQSDSFKIKDSKNLIIPGGNTSGEIDGDIVNDEVVKSFLSKKWEDDHFSLEVMEKSIQFDGDKDRGPGHEDPFYFYIFAKPFAQDNHYDTRLVLEGLFKRTPTSEPELRHFHVVFNRNGVNGVMANYIYKLAVTLTGEGSPNENEMLLNAHISAQIKVADWNVINQNETDTN